MRSKSIRIESRNVILSSEFISKDPGKIFQCDILFRNLKFVINRSRKVTNSSLDRGDENSVFLDTKYSLK